MTTDKEFVSRVVCEGCRYWKFCNGEALSEHSFCYEPEKDGDT